MLKIGKFVLLTQKELVFRNQLRDTIRNQIQGNEIGMYDLLDRLRRVTSKMLDLADIVKSALPAKKCRAVDRLKAEIKAIDLDKPLQKKPDSSMLGGNVKGFTRQ